MKPAGGKEATVMQLLSSCLQEEARVGHLEHPWNDSSSRTSRDPQCCPRHREQRRQQRWRSEQVVPRPRPLLRGPRHLRGALSERGLESHRHHSIFLLRHPATTLAQNPEAGAGTCQRWSLSGVEAHRLVGQAPRRWRESSQQPVWASVLTGKTAKLRR